MCSNVIKRCHRGMSMGWIGDQIVALRGDDFPAAVLALISLVTVLVGTWALLVAAIASIPGLRGLAIAFTPRVLRGVLFAGVAGALTVPATHADDRGVDGLRLPDRPLVSGAVAPAEKQSTVLVQSGDTLWAIARGRLGPEADASTTAHAVDRWHDANREVIGPDPDLIHPGQRLAPPSEDRP
jgi:nucleoid-associated protein YgaU